MKSIIEKELSYALVGLFYQVHQDLGRYCSEKQYGDALANKLKTEGINFIREFPISVEGRKSSFVDFLIEDKIVLELKSKIFIEKEDYYQIKRYLELLNKELGIIVNFRQKYLQPKRILNSKYSEHSDKFVVKDYVKAFTMIELIISMSLFLVLISVSVGGFIRSLQTQKTITNLMEASDSISLAMEKMTREIRDGYGFTQVSGSAVQFVNRYGQSVVYNLNGNAVERNGQKLTADNVNIGNFFVRLSSVDYGEGSQPRVTLGLSVSVNSKYLQNFSIPIQTTISPRMMILNSPN